MSIETRKRRLIKQLENREYRDAFVSSAVDVGVAFQVRTLRKQRNWTQGKLAEMSKKKQKTISDLENPSNSPSISTLKKIAAAFDVGLVVRFVPFSDMVKWDLNLSTEALEVSSFDEDLYFKENAGRNIAMADNDKYGVPPMQDASSNVVHIETLRANHSRKEMTSVSMASSV